MKKYLLVVYGNFKTQEECNEIGMGISDVVDSPQLKFIHVKGCLIFHFASEIDKEDIKDYLEVVLYEHSNLFILSEFTDKLSLHMTEEMKNHLFDLENNDDNVSIRVNVERNPPNLTYEEEDDEDFVALLLNDVKQNVAKPTLDQLLEKIKLKGVESLSVFEKDTLELYSK